jgi:sugar phosphate isomerase/epimerase
VISEAKCRSHHHSRADTGTQLTLPAKKGHVMPKHRITRRAALGTVAAAWPLAAASAAISQEQSNAGRKVVVGIATNSFHEFTNQGMANELSQAGVHTAQLFLTQSDSNYWRYNGRNDLSDLTPERCQQIAEAYRSAGVSIHSMAVYTNLIHPDEAELKANLAYFEEMFKVGRMIGVDKFITEAGHYESDGPVPRTAEYLQGETWDRMVTVFKQLAAIADGHGASVLVEPYFGGFFASAKRTRVFLEEVDSPRIRALLDPANLLELNDLEEMFDQLAPWIDCIHAKDRKLHTERGVAAGLGDIDYPKFVTLAAERTPAAPLILEYVGAKDYKRALAHLRENMKKVGVSEA